MVTIPKQEYEVLKAYEKKIQLIDEAIHEELSIKSLMKLQASQKTFAFLSDKAEDIYSEEDVK